MNYCDAMRVKIGNDPLIIVRPIVTILNQIGEILLYRYMGGIWSISVDILQLNESVEEFLKRKILSDIGLTINKLTLFGVYSGKELINRVEESGEEYQTVAIGYLCTDYKGEIVPDQNQGIEAEFFALNELPDDTDPFIKFKLVELKTQLIQ